MSGHGIDSRLYQSRSSQNRQDEVARHRRERKPQDQRGDHGQKKKQQHASTGNGDQDIGKTHAQARHADHARNKACGSTTGHDHEADLDAFFYGDGRLLHIHTGF